MVSNIICHIYTRPLVFETGSKSLSRTTTNKINPLCLDAFNTDVAPLQIQMRDGSVDLQHLSQFLAECDCARQGFDFTDDSHHDIYSPWTHHTSAPSSPQRQLPARLISTTVLFDFKAVAKAWPPWNAFRAIQFWCLLEKREFQCIDLRVLGLKRGCFHPTFLVMHYTKSKQMPNSWRSHDAKIEMF